MTLKRAIVGLVITLALTTFSLWFIGSEKRADSTSNMWRDITQQHRSANIMLGSSTIRRFDADQLLACGEWENRGIGTAGIPNILNYLDLPFKRWSPKWIIVYGGDNDVERDGLGYDETIALHNKLNNTLLERYPEASLLLLEIKPSPKRAQHHSVYRSINKYLSEFAANNDRAVFVSSNWEQTIAEQQLAVFLDDGVHLNALGNQIMATRINEACKSQ